MAQVSPTRYVRIDVQHGVAWMANLFDTTVVIGREPDCYWVAWKGEELQGRMEQLPGVHFFSEDDQHVIRLGCSVPEATLPKLEWQKVSDLVEISLPVSAMSADRSRSKPVSLTLVRSELEIPSTAALVDLRELKGWVELAPVWRLKRLGYCLNGERVLVMGEPLPPIPCQFFSMRGRILVPAGWSWSPGLDPVWVSEAFSLGPEEFLLWEATERWSIVSEHIMVPLSRSSIRQCKA